MTPLEHAYAVWRMEGNRSPAAIAGAIEAYTQELRGELDTARRLIDYDTKAMLTMCEEQDQLTAERDAAVESKAFTQQWYAQRFEPLKAWARTELSEVQKDEFFSIIANSQKITGDAPPELAVQLNLMRHERDAAQQMVAEMRQALELSSAIISECDPETVRMYQPVVKRTLSSSAPIAGQWVRREEMEKLEEAVRMECAFRVQDAEVSMTIMSGLRAELEIAQAGLGAASRLFSDTIADDEKLLEKVRAELASAQATSNERLKCIDLLLLKCRDKDNALAFARAAAAALIEEYTKTQAACINITAERNFALEERDRLKAEGERESKRLDWLFSLQSGGTINLPRECVQKWCGGESWRGVIDAALAQPESEQASSPEIADKCEEACTNCGSTDIEAESCMPPFCGRCGLPAQQEGGAR